MKPRFVPDRARPVVRTGGGPALPVRAQPVPAAPEAAPAAAATPAKPRPKIGLCAVGRRRSGLTHIGVLKVLHEMKVPIDYIAATSMGAIVAASTPAA
jgi:NTE family protein